MNNPVQKAKLLHSKWTAQTVTNREKHFIVTKVVLDEHQAVTDVILEAVHSKRTRKIPWRTLKDGAIWRMGWN